MTVTLYHLCASMRACVRTCVREFVCGGGFLDISTAGVRLKRLHSLHIQAESEKHHTMRGIVSGFSARQGA